MNQKQLSEFRFWPTLSKVFDQTAFDGSRRPSLYPSEASVISVDPDTRVSRVYGACHRKVWYRVMGFPESETTGVKSQYTFEFGNYLESMIRELSKKARIYNNNSTKFWDAENFVSGEIDLIITPYEDPSKFIFVEIKSTYGEYAEKDLCDHWEGAGKNAVIVRGTPKEAHLLQLGTYLWTHKDNENLVGGKLVYILRDNMTQVEFDIVIREVDGQWRFIVNGQPDMRFTVTDMYNRYEVIKAYIAKSLEQQRDGETPLPPARDFSLFYSDAAIELMWENGTIKKTAYENFKKDSRNRPGDWECNYCPFKSLCWQKEDVKAVTGDPNLEVQQPKSRIRHARG